MDSINNVDYKNNNVILICALPDTYDSSLIKEAAIPVTILDSTLSSLDILRTIRDKITINETQSVIIIPLVNGIRELLDENEYEFITIVPDAEKLGNLFDNVFGYIESYPMNIETSGYNDLKRGFINTLSALIYRIATIYLNHETKIFSSSDCNMRKLINYEFENIIKIESGGGMDYDETASSRF